MLRLLTIVNKRDRRAHPADPGGAPYTERERRDARFPRVNTKDRRVDYERAKEVASGQ